MLISLDFASLVENRKKESHQISFCSTKLSFIIDDFTNNPLKKTYHYFMTLFRHHNSTEKENKTKTSKTPSPDYCQLGVR